MLLVVFVLRGLSNLIEYHYSRSFVREEIADYCKNRWVALEGSYGDRRVFIRYLYGKPLVFNSPQDVFGYLKRYGGLRARTIYATLNVYRDLSSPDLLEVVDNIAYTTVFWDIDTVLDKWMYALRAAEVILDFLASEGVNESVYLAWSGEGVHVRLHEKAFSQELLREVSSLDVAYVVAEYVLRNTRDKLEALSKESGGVLKVENLVDPKRVFTTPLSLHRKHDLVAVFFEKGDINSFDLSWAQVSSPRHKSAWKRYREGEADDLARKALKSLTERKTLIMERERVLKRATRVLPHRRSGTMSRSVIGRFQVMGLLQAARYYLLTGDQERAKSFGLNRAVFYAWAKHHGGGYFPRRPGYYSSSVVISDREKKLVEVFGEEAFVSSRGFFVMGEREQLPEDYDKSIVEKINQVVPYEVAWEAALKYLSKFPESVLRDPGNFFEKVYEPVRDRFVELVVNLLADEETSEKKEDVREVESPRKPQERGLGPRTLLYWAKEKGGN